MGIVAPTPRRAGVVLIPLFALLATGLATAGYLSYRTYEHQFRAQVEHQLAAIADLKVRDLARWRLERLGDGSVFCENPAFSGLVRRWFQAPADGSTQLRIRVWLGKVREAYQYDQVILVDARGVLRMSVPDRPGPAGPLALQEAPEVLRSGRVIFKDFHRDAADGPIHLAVLAPVLDVDDESRPLGVVVLRISPERYLYPLLQRWPLPSSTAETLLVRRDGDDVLFLNELRFRTGTALVLRHPIADRSLPAARAALEQEGVEEGVDYRGVPVVAATRVVPDSPWSLVARMDAREVYAPLRGRLWGLVALAGATLLAVGSGFGLVWRQLDLRSARERYEAAEALTESDARFHLAADSAPIGIAQADPRSGRWLSVNPKMCSITGYSEEELLGLRVSDITHPEDRDADWEAFQRVVRGESASYRIEKRYVRKDGGESWVSVNMAVVRDATGQPVHTMATVEDINERRRAEGEILRLNAELEQRVAERTQRLKSANEEMEAFSYSVSHDLRAPLRHVDGFVGLLLERCRADLTDEGRHYLDVIADSARRMGRLIDELLEFSRNGRAEMHEAGVDMNKTMREGLDSVAGEWAGRSVEWVIGALPPVRGDAAMLRLVWANLLGNAVKYTRGKDRARIEVGALEGSDETTFFVRDDGVGFDMRYAHKLFGVFQRLHSEAQFEGTGIGLATVRRIVARHGGRTWAEGESGAGAAFFFSLPRTGGDAPCPS